ncbi:hypothetical protein I2494_03980 [Budviciaceae bacterium BWR-B9]|uniref:Uncharacterized protein n=1 Tax=Limnobaculum allomyrinae TaxID=2791986 RepID=A0ABS1IMA8_9GAMM|nr:MULTISPECIES: hypothetical protein [Limnobaculum]MBK5142882.1 hypothetical protein [Limnobaculum allomyrinae]MBV7690231.1 hypothetical protein [Limnobaculum sp. M2-1]
MSDLSPLDSWLRVSTWHTGHPKDDERFFKAIYQLIIRNEKMIEPDKVEGYILDTQKEMLAPSFLEDLAHNYARKYDVIYSFIYENKLVL